MDKLYFNQYLLTKRKGLTIDNFVTTEIGGYTLYTHSNLAVSTNQNGQSKITLIGYCVDYRNPSWTNQQIIESISIQSFEKVLDQLAFLSGVYLVVLKIDSRTYVIPDMCALREIYFRNTPGDVSISSSINLLQVDNPSQDLTDAMGFFESPLFKSRLFWVSDETNFSIIKRLKPNHYLDLEDGTTTRFFPVKENSIQPMEEAATKAGTVLQGILKAATLRSRVMMGLTAGWDSRLLLAASKEVKDRILFFLLRHKNIEFDIRISTRLAERFDLNHIQQRYPSKADMSRYDFVTQSLPNVNQNSPGLFSGAADFFTNILSISGASAEIARTEFGDIKHLTGDKLAALAKYSGHPYPIKKYNEWLEKNQETFKGFGYDLLDLFYWEEIVANKSAKAISEAHAIDRYIFPVFNCRYLMTTLLSVDKRHRQKHSNDLYPAIISKLWPEVLSEPVNPSLKKKVIRLMQKLGVYNLYRNIFPSGIKI